MPNIQHYLEWRSDIPFLLSPVNDVDELIFSLIGLFDWSDIVPEDGHCVPLHQAVKEYFRLDRAEKPGILISKQHASTLRFLPASVRFGSLELTGYRRDIAPSENKQFSALTIRIPGGRYYITFCGTDDSITGWKEDFLLSVEETIPAQKDAAEYLRFAAENYPGPLVVSGHSKGGNLAVYSAASVPEAVQARISRVISFDGPGFRREFLQTVGYRRIRSKCCSIMSEQALVGKLLFSDLTPIIVRTDAFGIAAHNGHNWETCPGGFVRCDEFSSFSNAFNESCDRIQDKVSLEDRSRFIEAVFSTLEATGAKTLTDLSEQNLKHAASMVHSLIKDPGIQKMATEFLESIVLSLVAERSKDLKSVKALQNLLDNFSRHDEKVHPADKASSGTDGETEIVRPLSAAIADAKRAVDNTSDHMPLLPIDFSVSDEA